MVIRVDYGEGLTFQGAVSPSCNPPVISVDRDEVEAQQSSPGHLCRVEILNPDGRIGRFWILAKIRNGRPVIETRTPTQTGENMAKKTTGTWRDFRRPSKRV